MRDWWRLCSQKFSLWRGAVRAAVFNEKSIFGRLLAPPRPEFFVVYGGVRGVADWWREEL